MPTPQRHTLPSLRQLTGALCLTLLLLSLTVSRSEAVLSGSGSSARFPQSEGEYEDMVAHNSALMRQWHLDNKKEEGVVTTGSGLQYKYLLRGEGQKYPNPGNSIWYHYNYSLYDGTPIFDTRVKNGKPQDMMHTTVQTLRLEGFIEAIQKARKGDVVRAYVPYKLAWMEGGLKNLVPPATSLIVDFYLYAIDLYDPLPGHTTHDEAVERAVQKAEEEEQAQLKKERDIEHALEYPDEF